MPEKPHATNDRRAYEPPRLILIQVGGTRGSKLEFNIPENSPFTAPS